MSDMKKIPEFKDLAEETKFWNENDSSDYIDWEGSKKTIFPNLKSSTVSISLRLPTALLARIKELANEKDVPYQSLMKVYLSDQVKNDLKMLEK